MKKALILSSLLVIGSFAYGGTLPFEVESELGRMKSAVQSARTADDKLKAKKATVERITKVRATSTLLKDDQKAALDETINALQIEIRDDPQNLVGKWKCYAIGLVDDTYEFKEGGAVANKGKKGTWSIENDRLVIKWPNNETDKFRLPINPEGMKGTSRNLDVTLKKLK